MLSQLSLRGTQLKIYKPATAAQIQPHVDIYTKAGMQNLTRRPALRVGSFRSCSAALLKRQETKFKLKSKVHSAPKKIHSSTSGNENIDDL